MITNIRQLDEVEDALTEQLSRLPDTVIKSNIKSGVDKLIATVRKDFEKPEDEEEQGPPPVDMWNPDIMAKNRGRR